jgi:hypothetical protein
LVDEQGLKAITIGLGGFITVFTVVMYFVFRWWRRKDTKLAEKVRKHPGSYPGEKFD